MRAIGPWMVRAVGAVVTVALAAVIVLGLFGLGFSGGVEDRFIELQDPDAPVAFTVVITDFDGSLVTLESGEGDELARPGSWGLEYPGGYGQLGEIVSQDGDAVTRAFVHTEGEPPPPGSVARLDSANWRGDPSDIGVVFSEVTYSTELGEYPAWLTGSPTDTWLIVVHDRATDRGEGLRLIGSAAEAGVRSMLITYRNDREAPDGPRGTYQWGRTEWRDLEGAVFYARDNGADQVVLAGYGMGGSIVLSFLGESDDADLVVGAILDSPVIELESTAAAHLDKSKLGAAFDMPTAINQTARLIAGWRFDIDWSDVDYGKTPPEIPMLIFHGDDDTETPLAESQAYAAAWPGLIDLVVSGGADYTESWNVDPVGYESAVASFLTGL
ncbi:MAG: hypothetical protein V3R84_08475 [Acidimicrobiia bacterium]